MFKSVAQSSETSQLSEITELTTVKHTEAVIGSNAREPKCKLKFEREAGGKIKITQNDINRPKQ